MTIYILRYYAIGIKYPNLKRYLCPFKEEEVLSNALMAKPKKITDSESGAGFTNDLRETLTYGELLKHEFCLILRTFE